SLTNLAGTPRLFGWTWDVKFREPEPTRCARDAFTVDQQAGVSDIAGLCYTDLDIDGRNTVVWGFTPIRGSIEPTIVAGRAPSADNESSLGRHTMNALHKRLGDAVRVGDGRTARDYVIVGQAVFPSITYGDVQHLADGATVTGGGFTRVAPKVDPNGNIT